MVKCKYCGDEIGDANPENCPEKPFAVILTRAEIWGLLDNYPLTHDTVVKKLRELIGPETGW